MTADQFALDIAERTGVEDAAQDRLLDALDDENMREAAEYREREAWDAANDGDKWE